MAMRIRRDDQVRSSPARTAARPAACCAWTPSSDRVYVEGLNIQKRHQRPRTLRDTQRGRPGRRRDRGARARSTSPT